MTRNPQKRARALCGVKGASDAYKTGFAPFWCKTSTTGCASGSNKTRSVYMDPSDQSDWACGQQQTPTSREIRSRRWKLAYRQNQHPLPQANPTVRTVNAGQCCAGQTLYPVLGLRKTRAFAASPRCWVLVSIFVLPFSAAEYHASRAVPRRLRHRPQNTA